MIPFTDEEVGLIYAALDLLCALAKNPLMRKQLKLKTHDASNLLVQVQKVKDKFYSMYDDPHF